MYLLNYVLIINSNYQTNKGLVNAYIIRIFYVTCLYCNSVNCLRYFLSRKTTTRTELFFIVGLFKLVFMIILFIAFRKTLYDTANLHNLEMSLFPFKLAFVSPSGSSLTYTNSPAPYKWSRKKIARLGKKVHTT